VHHVSLRGTSGSEHVEHSQEALAHPRGLFVYGLSALQEHFRVRDLCRCYLASPFLRLRCLSVPFRHAFCLGEVDAPVTPSPESFFTGRRFHRELVQDPGRCVVRFLVELRVRQFVQDGVGFRRTGLGVVEQPLRYPKVSPDPLASASNMKWANSCKKVDKFAESVSRIKLLSGS